MEEMEDQDHLEPLEVIREETEDEDEKDGNEKESITNPDHAGKENDSVGLPVDPRSKMLTALYFMCEVFQSVLLFLVFIFIVFLLAFVISSSYNNSSVTTTQPTSSTDNTNSILSILDYVNRIGSVLGFRSPQPTLPTLILQITLDQFRTDFLTKYRKRFVKNGGFNRLLKNGVFYRNAHYRNNILITPLGHSCLFTGGTGLSHGFPTKTWYDRDLRKMVYCIENHNYTETNGNEEIRGSAPTYLQSTTTGDELRVFTNASKMFSVSPKDVPGILMAGHTGKGFWWSFNTGNFISSTYFYDKYPDYVTSFNQQKLADSYLDKHWELSYPINEYHHQNREYPEPVDGKSFPKPFYKEDLKDFYDGLLRSPVCDELMWKFAKNLIVNEELGKRKDDTKGNTNIIDMLALSFSSVDKVGHQNGPNSIEMEDTIYKLDRLLGEVLDFFDSYIGLSNVLVAVSADHGSAKSYGLSEDIGFDHDRLVTQVYTPILEDHLNKTIFKGQLTKPLVVGWPSSNIYFDHQVIKAHGIKLRDIQQEAAEFLMEDCDQVLFAFSKSDILRGHVPKTPVGEAVSLDFHPKRSGDVVLVVKEQIFVSKEKDSKGTISKHGSMWSYDTFIPVLFMGPDVPKGLVVDRRITPEDVAPTISSYFGLNLPSGCLGNPLEEVLRNHDVSKLLE